MEPLAGLLGAAGFALGLAADRLATRWPEHDTEESFSRADPTSSQTVRYGLEHFNTSRLLKPKSSRAR